MTVSFTSKEITTLEDTTIRSVVTSAGNFSRNGEDFLDVGLACPDEARLWIIIPLTSDGDVVCFDDSRRGEGFFGVGLASLDGR